MKCRDKAGREIEDMKIVEMKPGRFAAKGKCAECGTGMYKILKKEDADEMKEDADEMKEDVDEMKRAA